MSLDCKLVLSLRSWRYCVVVEWDLAAEPSRAAKPRATASSLLLFFGTRLRRQNFNLAPTQYRQLRRLASFSPLPRLWMNRCKTQAQRLSKDFLCTPSRMSFLVPDWWSNRLDPSLPINNHVTYNCAAREARGSRSTLYPPFLPLTLWIIPVLLTGLSRAFVCEYFKGTSVC